MLQSEFEERIGRKVTTEEYVEANAMYMAAGKLDKDEFCSEWLKIGSSKLVQCLFEAAHRKDQDLQEQQLGLKEGQEIISDAADAMLEILDLVIEARDKSEGEYSAIDAIGVKLDKKIAWLIGRGETTKRKVRKGIAMSPEDADYIINNLK
ncbi:MAG: hypothetical protein IKG99_13060 [Bacteroidaceae bacterium]|nr:hypothetical protein [Bacteroidaceae bacterium]